jgi:hypothetical protein
MKGDFTRDTFDRAKHFSSVLMQQGRVMLDADYNEQSAILLHYLRTLARDIIGPYAAPVENAGFFLHPDKNGGGFSISAGRYYVDGILVENESACTYADQPSYQLPPDDKVLKESENGKGQGFWAYLDVWERHITSLEDDDIREKALGGPDTCTRSKVVWQVKVLPVKVGKNGPVQKGSDQEMSCEMPLAELVTLSSAKLAARVDPGQKIDDPCVTSPDSKYRGAENQLYRVEIHAGGKAGDATFKWSRDNGSNATAWLGTDGNDLEVANTRGFRAGGWAELTDESHDLAGEPGVLVKIAKVEGGRLSIDPETVPQTGTPLAWSEQLLKPKVRHWNQARRGDIELEDGAILFEETSANAEGWIDLEDGIQVRFEAGGEYRSGDYWLIPARVATGKLEWPAETKGGKDVALLLPPKGVEHHYAPLGFMAWKDEKWLFKSCRCDFEPLSSCFAKGSIAVGANLIKRNEAIKTTPPPPPAKRGKTTRKKPTQ